MAAVQARTSTFATTRRSRSCSSALLESYRDWGGTAQPPQIAIVDWREVPTWSEFELLRDAFTAAGVPTLIADPRDLVFDGRALTGGGHADRPRLSPRPHQRHRRRAPTSAARWSTPIARRAVCVANTPALQDLAQEGVLRGADRRALRGALHPGRARRHRRARAVDARRPRASWPTICAGGGEQLVLKPNDEYGGTGVTLGWETSERAVGRGDRPRAPGTGTRLGRAGADQHPPGDVPGVRRGRRRRRARHAGGLRAVSVSRAGRGLPDAAERDRASPTSRPAAARCPPSSSTAKGHRWRCQHCLEPFRRSSTPGARNAVEVCLAIKPERRSR